jgi:hypothetical protein
VKAGQSLILTVNITGEPLPKASWQCNGTDIRSGTDVTVEGDGTFSRLTIKNASSNNTARYTVTAENSIGSDKADFDCVIQGEIIKTAIFMTNARAHSYAATQISIFCWMK